MNAFETAMVKSASSKDNRYEQLEKLILENQELKKMNEQLRVRLGKCIVSRDCWKTVFDEQTRLYQKLERKYSKLKGDTSSNNLNNVNEKIDIFDYFERIRLFGPCAKVRGRIAPCLTKYHAATVQVKR